MDLSIQQTCPSCGASIKLYEDDTLITCSFCGVKNYKIESVADRFLLSAKNLPASISSRDLIYVPYIRFKGSIYFIQNQEVRHKIVDTTRIGIKNAKLPVSLGLRPQAIPLKPVVSSIEGNFIQQSVPTKTAFINATKTFDLFQTKAQRNKKQIYHRAFIGETLSRIYQPFYLLGDNLYDATTNRAVGDKKLIEGFLGATCVSKLSWEPRFISTHCPGCGGLLSGERDSSVVHCQNCETMWKEEKQRFIPVDWQIVQSDQPGVKYLPFWKISFTTGGAVKLESFGDYIRFTNQPVVARRTFDDAPLVFLLPAFKLNPKAYLQLCSQLSLMQNKLPSGKTRRVAKAYPVNLNEKEALQAVKTVLASTTLAREKRYPLLPELMINKTQSHLMYLPFEQSTHDLVQEHTRASVQTAALRYGRSL